MARRQALSRRPAHTTDRRASLMGAALGGAGFLPVWIVVGVLLVVSTFIAPDTLSGASLRVILPLATFLAVASLGEMLVVMTGGIDLSIPAVITMAGTVMIGVSGGADGQLFEAVVFVLLWALAIGLANGLLVGLLGLNPLLVTLAVGQVAFGLTTEYRSGIANESAVPPALASWAGDRFLGISWVFWTGIAITLVVAAVLRHTSLGRRFQAVGANPRAALVAGMPVRRYQIAAYTAAGVLYGIVGILLAAFIRSPTLDVGVPYLLGPIAAVVIGGASLTGGVASASSTWVAAFGLTVLSQMLRVLGLPSALQFVVFGSAIAVGMIVSGDRVVAVLARLTQRPDAGGDQPPLPPPAERDAVGVSRNTGRTGTGLAQRGR